MFNVGGGELLVIMLIALIVLGPQRLPGAAKQVGRVMGDLRRISSGFQQELKDALDEPEAPTPLRRKESVPLAAAVKDAAGAEAPQGDDADSAPAPAAAGDGTTLAPAVAAALDEVVTPLEAPSADIPAGDATEPAAPAPDQTGAVGAGGPGDIGDERAAS